MGKNKEIKTNAMRILDRLHISYEHQSYECEEFIDGLHTAERLGLPFEQVYKTLVTRGQSGGYFVFVIPIAGELDMKKVAKAVGEKSVAMLHVKEITEVTGYVRGGCTAIGMKKQYVTRVDSSAEGLEEMYVSGGKIGVQLKLKPADLLLAARAEYADLLMEHGNEGN
jgi:Cys-tRNA(Pro)/Cys-tRNA(Cys) deacylase